MGFEKYKGITGSIKVIIAITSLSMLLGAGGIVFIFWGQTVVPDPQLVQYGWALIICAMITFAMGFLSQTQTGTSPHG